MADGKNDQYSRFQVRLWDGARMHQPLGYSWFAERGIRDVGDLRGELARSGAALMQCTGVRDRRGRDIYEGDIVVGAGGAPPCRGTVAWEDGRWQTFHWCVRPGACGLADGIDGDDRGDGDPSDWEVIGNAHEHPDLTAPRAWAAVGTWA